MMFAAYDQRNPSTRALPNVFFCPRPFKFILKVTREMTLMKLRRSHVRVENSGLTERVFQRQHRF